MTLRGDPRHFEMTALALLREHAPLIATRIDVRSFGLTRPLDLLQARSRRPCGRATPGSTAVGSPSRSAMCMC